MANFAHLAQVGMEPEHLVLWAWHWLQARWARFRGVPASVTCWEGVTRETSPRATKLHASPSLEQLVHDPGPGGRPEHLIWWAGLSVHGSSRPVDDGRAPTKLAFFFLQ